jgi:hypothetical protein
MSVPSDYLNMNFGVGSEQLSNYRNAMPNYPMHLSYNPLNDTASNNALKQHSTNMYLNSMSGKFIFIIKLNVAKRSHFTSVLTEK